MTQIGLWGWICWASVGLVAGLFTGRAMGGNRIMVIDILISLAGALFGGFGSALAIGFDTPQLFIISVLIALFVAGLSLWVASRAFYKDPVDEEEELEQTSKRDL